MLKRDNQSEKHLVVGSLEVIGDIRGKGVKAIRDRIESLANSVTVQANQMKDYWKEVASDGYVTSAEKKTLRKEWNEIETVHSAIMSAVEGASLQSSVEWSLYSKAYRDLEEYLFVTLRLFDSMSKSQPIPAPDEFSGRYEEYYLRRQEMQTALMNGIAEGAIEQAASSGHLAPDYRGPYITEDAVISSLQEGELKSGDWIMWGGETISTELTAGGRFVKSFLYRADKIEGVIIWSELTPDELDEQGFPRYSKQYMQALTDILSTQEAGSGYFSTVFASAFFANSAAISALQTKTITLQADGGELMTSDYVSGGEHGFRFMSDSNAELRGLEYPVELNGAVHIGGRCVIDGDARVSGEINARTGEFSAACIFKGAIISGPLELSNTSSPGLTLDFRNVDGITAYRILTEKGVRQDVVYNTNPDLSFFVYSFGRSRIFSFSWRNIGDEQYPEVEISGTYEDEFSSGVYRETAGMYSIVRRMYLTQTDPNSFTMKLKNLPKTKPEEKNSVWNNNGTLCIVE